MYSIYYYVRVTGEYQTEVLNLPTQMENRLGMLEYMFVYAPIRYTYLYNTTSNNLT